MANEQLTVERIEIPKGFNPIVTEYLIALITNKSALMIKNGNLRGRKYSKGTVSGLENRVSTTDIRNLIAKGFLVKATESDGYTVLILHPFVSEYIKGKSRKSPFEVENAQGYSTKIGHFRAPLTDERSDLKNKGKVITAPCHPNTFKREAFRNGYDYSDIFCFVKDNNPCYVILGVKDTQFYQVYPKDVYKSIKLTPNDSEKESKGIKLTSVEPQKDAIPFQHTITENSISIVSYETSTSYINFTKQAYPTFDEIVEKYKLAKKYLKENDVQTLGKKQADKLFSDAKQAKKYSDFLEEYNSRFEELLRLSKDLVKVGIVSGGTSRNPIYRQAWELQNSMSKLVRQNGVPTILDKNTILDRIINLQETNELDRYIKVTL